jgi:CHAT domain-containing protein
VNYNLGLAHQLYKDLVKGILDIQKNKQEIIVIPDKHLFKIPFESLVTGFNKKELDPNVIFSEYSSANYLIQDYSVTYYFSLFHLQKHFKKKTRNLFTISAFGDPLIQKAIKDEPNGNLRELRYQLFREIPSSRQEILGIKNIFGETNSHYFLGKAFTRNNFQKYAPQSRIIHLATHFVNNLQYPQHSVLLFSTVKDNPPLLYANEIFKLKLNAELLVLSACESSEKNLMGIQGLRGMTASFRNSGVKSMVVSMWPVDQMNCRLIPLFYQEYKQHRNAPLALRKAKLDLMKQKVILENQLEISFSHPFLWANYILYDFYY